MKTIFTGSIIRKIVCSSIVIGIALLSYSESFDSILDKTFISGFDQSGSEYYDETLKRAFYTFAITRGINGLISVIQGTEVALSPAGIGITLTVGEILDPINDLVERFSWVMLISTTSLGIQKILMEVGKWLGLKVILTISMLIILTGIWLKDFFRINFVSLGYKMILMALVIRFCMPVVALASEKIYDLFLKDKYSQSTESLNKIKMEIRDPYEIGRDEKVDKNDSNFWTYIKKRFLNAKEVVDVKKRLELLKDKVSNSVQYTIDLIIVFLLQTVIIPIFILWSLLRLTGYLFSSTLFMAFEKKLKDVTKGSKVSKRF